MRDSIRKQLESCAYAIPTHYDKETNTYFIPRYTAPTYKIGHCYIVKVADNIVNNISSIIAVNWNHGTAPAVPYLKVYVSKTAGKMLYVDSIAYDIASKKDLMNMWSGWLSIDDLTMISAE